MLWRLLWGLAFAGAGAAYLVAFPRSLSRVVPGKAMVGTGLFRRNWRTAGAGIAALFLLYVLLWQAGTSQQAGYRQVVAAISAHEPEGTTIWHNDHWNIATFLNLYQGGSDIVGVNETADVLSASTAERLSSLAESARPVWVVSTGVVGAQDAVERLAAVHKGPIEAFGAFAPVTGRDAVWEKAQGVKAGFYFDTADWSELPADYVAGVDGEPSLRLSAAEVTPETEDGVIAARLVWEALEPVKDSYQAFVQLRGPGDEPVALNVGQIQNGRGQMRWRSGESVANVYAFALPSNAPAGEYNFVVSVRRMSDLRFIQAPDGRDEAVLGPVAKPGNS